MCYLLSDVNTVIKTGWLLSQGEKYLLTRVSRRGKSRRKVHFQNSHIKVDVTREARAIVQTIQQMCPGGRYPKNFTIIYIVDIFRGSEAKKIMNNGKFIFNFRNLRNIVKWIAADELVVVYSKVKSRWFRRVKHILYWNNCIYVNLGYSNIYLVTDCIEFVVLMTTHGCYKSRDDLREFPQFVRVKGNNEVNMPSRGPPSGSEEVR